MRTIEKVLKRFEERKKATKRAKKDLKEILDFISKHAPSVLEGCYTRKRFLCKWHFWRQNGAYWVHRSQMCCFGFYNGRAEILWEKGEEMSPTELDVSDEDFDYIDLRSAIPALQEFLQKLQQLPSFEGEAKTIAAMRECIK